MKTSTVEVLCDGCAAPIPAAYPRAIFATLRGPLLGHRKFDFHGAGCLAQWAAKFTQDELKLAEADDAIRAAAGETR